MFSNRFASFWAAQYNSAAPAQLVAVAAAAQTFGASSGQAMLMVPSFTLASWQEQVYRLAYQQALADTAPPRHFARYFSVWN